MTGRSSQQGRSLSSKVISGVRSALYSLTEPRLLSIARITEGRSEDKGTVDVIIPTYNRCDLLMSRALPSVLAQTYQKFRVIVAVHGSTDGTLGALHVRYGRDPRVTWIRVPRKRRYPPTAENHWFAGPVDPLNAGLDAVNADWIARMDDDDEWTPDHLAVLLSFARASGHEFVSSAHGGPNGKVFPYILGIPDQSWVDTSIIGFGTKVGGCQTWLYRSYLRIFRYNRHCWRKSWNQPNDCDLQDRMWRAGVRMGYLDHVTCYVKPRPGSRNVGLADYTQNRDNIERAYAFSTH